MPQSFHFAFTTEKTNFENVNSQFYFLTNPLEFTGRIEVAIISFVI